MLNEVERTTARDEEERSDQAANRLLLPAGNATLRSLATGFEQLCNEQTRLGDRRSAPRCGSRSTDRGHADARRLRTTASVASRLRSGSASTVFRHSASAQRQN
jgi:hypothetical protein